MPTMLVLNAWSGDLTLFTLVHLTYEQIFNYGIDSNLAKNPLLFRVIHKYVPTGG